MKALAGWALFFLALGAAVVIVAGCAASRHAPAGCHTPAAVSGTTVSVDGQGNASSPYTGGTGFRCDDGTWVRIGQ